MSALSPDHVIDLVPRRVHAEVQLRDPPVAGDAVLDQRADESPPLATVVAGRGDKLHRIIEALPLACVASRLGVLESNLTRLSCNPDPETDAAGFLSRAVCPFHTDPQPPTSLWKPNCKRLGALKETRRCLSKLVARAEQVVITDS